MSNYYQSFRWQQCWSKCYLTPLAQLWARNTCLADPCPNTWSLETFTQMFQNSVLENNLLNSNSQLISHLNPGWKWKPMDATFRCIISKVLTHFLLSKENIEPSKAHYWHINPCSLRTSPIALWVVNPLPCFVLINRNKFGRNKGNDKQALEKKLAWGICCALALKDDATIIGNVLYINHY